MKVRHRKHRRTVKIGDITHTEGKVFTLGDSMAMTVPVAWIREHGIKPGDTVVKIANSVLTITTKNNQREVPASA